MEEELKVLGRGGNVCLQIFKDQGNISKHFFYLNWEKYGVVEWGNA